MRSFRRDNLSAEGLGEGDLIVLHRAGREVPVVATLGLDLVARWQSEWAHTDTWYPNQNDSEYERLE